MRVDWCVCVCRRGFVIKKTHSLEKVTHRQQLVLNARITHHGTQHKEPHSPTGYATVA